MSSTITTALGLNQWASTDKPVREDFVKDNEIIDTYLSKLNNDFNNSSTAEVPASNLNLSLRYRKKGNCKSFYIEGIHTPDWIAGTTYAIATADTAYKPSYGWNKIVIYKTVNMLPHYALLAMSGSGALSITPITVASGGTIRIHEIYF